MARPAVRFSNREYRRVRPALIGSVVQLHSDGAPAFCVLEDGSPRLGVFFFGGILSVAVLTTVSGLILHGGKWTAIDSAIRDLVSSSLRSTPSGSATPQDAEDSKQESVAYGPPPLTVPQPNGQRPTDASNRDASGAKSLNATERQRVIDQTIANLKRFYFDKDVAQKTADALLLHEKNGDDNAAKQVRHLLVC